VGELVALGDNSRRKIPHPMSWQAFLFGARSITSSIPTSRRTPNRIARSSPGWPAAARWAAPRKPSSPWGWHAVFWYVL